MEPTVTNQIVIKKATVQITQKIQYPRKPLRKIEKVNSFLSLTGNCADG